MKKLKLKKNKRNSRRTSYIIVMIIVVIILISILGSFAMYLFENRYMGELPSFPGVQVTIKDLFTGDEMQIKHVYGKQLDWSIFKIIIYNNSDKSDYVIMRELDSLGIIRLNEVSTLNSSIDGFNDIDFKKGLAYQMLVYDKDSPYHPVYVRHAIFSE